MENKKMTTPIISVGADTEQSPNVCNDSITDFNEDGKSLDDYLEEMQKEFSKQMSSSYLKTVSMSELYDTVFNVQTPLIDGLLQRGTYIFAGSPKVGKSFMMAQLAYHISTGTQLWNYTVRKGTVLYLALEDDYRRLQERLYRMFGTDGAENLFFSVSAGQLGNGLDEQLTRFMQEHPDTKLIIIDTLQKVREVGGDNYSYANDYEIITRLKKFADSYGITLLLVHHTRKQQADDSFETISGTTGLLGCADGSLLMQKKKRTELDATIKVVGRDQPDQILYLKKDPQAQIWNLERMENELYKEPPDPVLDAVQGVVHCRECGEGGGEKLPLSAACVTALEHILHGPSRRLYSFTLGPEDLELLDRAAEGFAAAQLERSFRTLGYYKAILI